MIRLLVLLDKPELNAKGGLLKKAVQETAF